MTNDDKQRARAWLDEHAHLERPGDFDSLCALLAQSGALERWLRPDARPEKCTAGDGRSIDCLHCGAPVGVTCAEHKRATSESSFKVGDRVRITKVWARRAGREGEIVALDESSDGYLLYVVSGDPKKGEGHSICRRAEIEPVMTGLPSEVAVAG